MDWKPVRILLVNGIATVNLRGSVKTSLDDKKDEVELSHCDYGINVDYMEKGVSRRQLIPNGCFSNVLYAPDPKNMKVSKSA